MLSCATVVLAAGVASGQDYPNRSIRIIAGPAGGGGDFQARTIAQGITGALGQPVVIENRPNNLLGEIASKAPPDGYTVLLTGGSLWSQPFLLNVSYDPVKDFAPITLIERSPSLLVVHPSLPVKSVKELIALAKSKPGQLNYNAASSDTRLAGELFKSMAGINIVIVPYSSNAMGYGDLLSGQIQLTFGNILQVTPHIKSGRLKVLGVTTATPSAMYPELPTIAATVPGFEKASIGAMFMPAKTPEAIINRLNQEIGRFMSTPEAKQRFANAGSEAVSSTPQELAATMKAEMARLGKVIKEAGIRAN